MRFSAIEYQYMKKNNRYSVEFKKEAVRLMVIEGRPTTELAEELGIQRNLLYRWKSEHVDSLEAQAEPGQPSPKKMAAELEELRKKLRKSERMNEILKKTVGYFAEEK
ncbi:transposase, partial [Puniceicoccaceae bacterium K14]|nr:transposase [Puniceicoccaceae bacterium K14]